MERALIGALLSDGAAMCRVAHIISHESFYIPKLRLIYAAISDMYERGDAVDMITVADKLRANRKLDEVGGIPMLSDLAAECPTSANIERYAEVIESAYYHRSTQRILAEAHAELNDRLGDAEVVMTNMLDRSAKLRAKRGIKQPISSRDAVKKTLDRLAYIKSKKYTGGIQTGLDRLDRIIVEFDPGELVFIAARPSIGKTALAQAIADFNGQKGVPGMFWSGEMGIDQVVQRSVSRQSDVSLNLLRSRYPLRSDQQAAVNLASERISNWPIIWDENKYANAREIGNAIRAVAIHTPIKWVVLDQLSKIVPDSTLNDKEYRMHLNAVISGLKNIANGLGITMFVLHQINRDVKDSKDYRPRIEDLKDTGKVEEDADAVILIHRPEYYNNPKLKNFKVAGDEYDVVGHAEIIVAKRRQGATGSAAVGYVGSLTKFHNLDAPQTTVAYNPTPEPPELIVPSEPPKDEELPF